MSQSAATFLRLFDGYEQRHIETNTRGAQKNDKGKLDARILTKPGPITLELARVHIEGGIAVGVAPVKTDSTCTWGVLDVDWYDMPEDDVREVMNRVGTRCAAFRTKSRGLHVYVFTDEPVPARVMHDYLVALRKRLPRKVQNVTEIFPPHSQTRVSEESRPTAVNLPLNGQTRGLAWLIDDGGARVVFDDVGSAGEIFGHIDSRCRVDADVIRDFIGTAPVLDHSEMGYRVPADPAGRNDLLLKVAASMQARGWPDDKLVDELHRINGETRFHDVFADGPLPGPEVKGIIKRTLALEKGTPTPLHYRVIEKFNRRWSKITINGNVEYLDKSASDFTTFTKQHMFDETSDRVVKIGKSMVAVAQLWLRDPDHARCTGVVCEPVDYDGPAYNVWRGFNVEPIDGDASLFEKYILDVLCAGDAGLANWVTMWLADACQRPTEPSPPTAIALRGPQGSGKSFLQERILTPIFGERYVQKVQESERLFSRFNRGIFGSTFIACEESIFHGSHATAAKLKSFISSPSWTYEEKHKAVVQAKNVHRLIATTNETQAVHLDRDDRRWTVIEVAQPFDMNTPDGQKAAYAFWEPYHAFMKSPEGPGIVLQYLLHYPVDRRALTYGYGTAAKARDLAIIYLTKQSPILILRPRG